MGVSSLFLFLFRLFHLFRDLYRLAAEKFGYIWVGSWIDCIALFGFGRRKPVLDHLGGCLWFGKALRYAESFGCGFVSALLPKGQVSFWILFAA